MGTKNQPAPNDCYAKAEPDEPYFVLLARDAGAPNLVEIWAADRAAKGEDPAVVEEARENAVAMREWRKKNRPDKK
jgi:hypothetical protein